MKPSRPLFLLIALVSAMAGRAQGDTTLTQGARIDTVTAAPEAIADTLGGRTDTPTSAPPDTTVLHWRQRHKPLRATLYSAIIPGAGQIYNRKYWKAPIVWGGLATCVYFIQDNDRQFQRYKTAYLANVDNDPLTTDEFNGQYSPDQLRQVANTYQRWRDLSYVAIGLVYILNVVDATVDGYFVRFDVGRDLSMHVAPSASLAANGAFGMSVGLTIR